MAGLFALLVAVVFIQILSGLISSAILKISAEGLLFLDLIRRHALSFSLMLVVGIVLAFLARNFGKRDRRPIPLNVESAKLSIRLNDDSVYEQNKDVLKGMIFNAVLKVQTPLSVLEHHGEIFSGPPSMAPTYGTEAQGIWIYKSKSWSELSDKAPVGFEHETEHETDIGLMLPSQYLPFLKEFRRLVESDRSKQEKLNLLENLVTSTPTNRQIWTLLRGKYRNFPQSFL